MIVISDTTPLSSLIQLDRLFLLKNLFSRILIPVEVAEELFQNLHLKSIIISNESWIEICTVKNISQQSELIKLLDKGESAAISLALERHANIVLIDERKGKQIAERYGLETTGTLGILIKAKQIGLLEKIRPDIFRLKNELNFWISDSLINDILRLVNE